MPVTHLSLGTIRNVQPSYVTRRKLMHFVIMCGPHLYDLQSRLINLRPTSFPFDVQGRTSIYEDFNIRGLQYTRTSRGLQYTRTSIYEDFNIRGLQYTRTSIYEDFNIRAGLQDKRRLREADEDMSRSCTRLSCSSLSHFAFASVGRCPVLSPALTQFRVHVYITDSSLPFRRL